MNVKSIMELALIEDDGLKRLRGVGHQERPNRCPYSMAMSDLGISTVAVIGGVDGVIRGDWRKSMLSPPPRKSTLTYSEHYVDRDIAVFLIMYQGSKKDDISDIENELPFGPQEDSFTKDEIISAYTRNRVEQITGATNEMERRSGNVLPPPADDFSYNKSTSAWPKPITKTTTNNSTNGMKVPLTNSSNGKSLALPAAASWGTRTSNSQLSLKESTKQQPDMSTSAVASPFHGDELEKEKGSLVNPVSIKEDMGRENKNISTSLEIHHSDPVRDEAERQISPLSVDTSSNIFNKNKKLQACESEQFSEPLTTNETENTSKQSDLVSDLQNKVAISEAEQDMLSFNDQRLKDTQVIQNNSMGFDRLHAHAPANGGQHPPSSLHVVNGYSSDVISISSREVSNGNLYHHGSEGYKSQMGGLDLGESSIISNILSMDFDPWDESLTSPRNLAKLLGESDKQVESHRVLSSRKAQNSNQSRFSFTRQDEGTDQGSNNGDFGFGYKNSRSDFVSNNNSVYVDNKLSNGNGFSSFSYGESENFATNYLAVKENKISDMFFC